MKGPTISGLLATAAVVIGYCTMCFWLCPKGEIEHPDLPIVRSAAKDYLDADEISVLEYEGHGGSGGSGIWWARVRLLDASRAAPNPPDSLRAYVKRWRDSEYFDGYLTRGELAKVPGSVPAWWRVDRTVYAVRHKGGGGFFASPGDAPGEWHIMCRGR